MRTSDIHINPEKERVLVRYRVDGMLREVITIPKDLQLPLTSRLKIMANMDIAETPRPSGRAHQPENGAGRVRFPRVVLSVRQRRKYRDPNLGQTLRYDRP